MATCPSAERLHGYNRRKPKSGEFVGCTPGPWRIIPLSKGLITISPLSRVVGPLTNGRFMAYKLGLLTT